MSGSLLDDSALGTTLDEEDDEDGEVPEYEHVLAISDLHWGSPDAYVDGDEAGERREDEGSIDYDSLRFLEERFFRNDQPRRDGNRPDALLLVGDIIELWWRGITAAVIESSRGLDTIRRIQEAGTDVYLISGNHDWWLMKNNDDGPIGPPHPWQFREEFYFESGDREFVAVHGHQGDPLNFNPVTNQAFCLGDDELGYTAYTAWTSREGGFDGAESPAQAWQRGVDEFSTEYYSAPSQPSITEQQLSIRARENQDTGDDPRRGIEDAVSAMYEDYIIFGHTHIPVQTDEYVNCGAWTARGTDEVRDRTYVEVENGDVSLWDWQPDGGDERIDPE